MPFVVTTFRDKIETNHEETFDIVNILRARELMTRIMIDPVYGKKRYFYRFCEEKHLVMKIYVALLKLY